MNERRNSDLVTIKAFLNNECKRFGIPPSTSISNLVSYLSKLFSQAVTSIQYQDEDNDLVSINSDDELKIAMNNATKTNNILRLVLYSDELQSSKSSSYIDLTKSDGGGDESVFINEDFSCDAGKPGKQENRKSLKNKTKGCVENRSTCSSNSSTSASSSSSCSSSEIEIVEDCQYKRLKKKGGKSPKARMEKILQRYEKSIVSSVASSMEKQTEKLRDDMVTSLSSAILQKLDGAILQSFSVPNGTSSHNAGASLHNAGGSTADQSHVKRIRYQHLNVVCDACENEIFGPRYKCGNCSDYDLCETCEGIEGIHTPSHVFLKMHYPAALVGRRSVGGRSRPLLRANVYEERENDREKEDILQRKLDSGSELNQTLLENHSDLKLKKVNEIEQQSREVARKRKEEWKKMKKEIKRGKKELGRKIKQGKIMQRNIRKGLIVMPKDANPPFFNPLEPEEALVRDTEISVAVSSLQLNKNAVASLPQTEHREPGVVNTPYVIIKENETPDVKDEDIEIAENIEMMTLVDVDDLGDGYYVSEHGDDAMIDLTSDSDVVVVPREFVPLNLNLDQDNTKIPDLVDFQNEPWLSSPLSEDFIVVPNYFDLTVPLDNRCVDNHQNCENCQNIEPYCTTTTSTTTNELPVDLVPLVVSPPLTAFEQPDITVLTPQHLNKISETPVVDSETPAVEINSESLESTAEQDVARDISSHSDIDCEQLSQETETETETESETETETETESRELPEIVSGELPEIVSDETVNVTESYEPPIIDLSNPIILSQVTQEQCIRDSLDKEHSPLHSENVERDSNTDVVGASSNEGTESGGIASALKGAVANIVGTVGQVVQSVNDSVNQAVGPLTNSAQSAEYSNGHVQLSTSVDSRAKGMKQLLEMGFFDRALNDRLLVKHSDDVSKCVAELIAGVDSNWHQSRW